MLRSQEIKGFTSSYESIRSTVYSNFLYLGFLSALIRIWLRVITFIMYEEMFIQWIANRTISLLWHHQRVRVKSQSKVIFRLRFRRIDQYSTWSNFWYILMMSKLILVLADPYVCWSQAGYLYPDVVHTPCKFINAYLPKSRYLNIYLSKDGL